MIGTTFGITEPTVGGAAEVECKLAAVRALAERLGLSAVVLLGADAVAWVTGGLTNRIESGSPVSAAAVVVTPGAAHVVTANVELPRLAAEARLDEFELHAVDWYEPDGLARRAAELADAPSAQVGGLGVDIADELVALRLALQPAERQRLRALALDTTAALESAVREWSPGERDVDVQARLVGSLESAGCFGACVIVGGDERVERFRHPLAAGVPVRRLLMAVVVAERHGLHVAATRFASAGPLPEPVRRAARAAADVERDVLAATTPSATYGDVLLELASAYERAGHPGAWREHYQGGPVGYRQREFEIVPTQTGIRWFGTAIAAGTAVAWNPSVAGGGKCEDTYLVLDDGLERLTDSGAWPLEDARPAVLDVASGEAA